MKRKFKIGDEVKFSNLENNVESLDKERGKYWLLTKYDAGGFIKSKTTKGASRGIKENKLKVSQILERNDYAIVCQYIDSNNDNTELAFREEDLILIDDSRHRLYELIELTDKYITDAKKV